jgi:hypothetical protein
VDPTNQYQGNSVFRILYPNVIVGTLSDAMACINATHAAHPSDLASVLEANPALRLSYIRAHQTAQIPAAELLPGDPQRSQVYEFYSNMAPAFPNYFAKCPQRDPGDYPTLAWVRERVFRSAIDALPLDVTRVHEIAAFTGLSGTGYEAIWLDHQVWLLDNCGLDSSQKELLHRYLDLIPSGLHNLRFISVTELLGTPSIEIPLAGDNSVGWVNIFGVRISDAIENSFPDDVSAGLIPTFCACAAHEVNHIVDAFAVGGNPGLCVRKTALIQSAGRDHLNYLRSMLADGFFADAPQEFFASIANEWFTDSEKTLKLGLVRFDQGRLEPINQAIFFAEVYSRGGDATYFYITSPQGVVTRQAVPVDRDQMGRITALSVGSERYVFTLDHDGNVTGYSTEEIPPTPQPPSGIDPHTWRVY